MLNVDKQPDWEDVETGVVKANAPVDCLETKEDEDETV